MGEQALSDEQWCQSIGKIELHLHLEGAIPLTAIRTLAAKYGREAELGNDAELAARFQFQNFEEFVRAWVWKNEFLREPDDFRFIASQTAAWLLDQNVLHAEFFCSPSDFSHLGMGVSEILSAIDAGLSEQPLSSGLIVDVVRNYGEANAMRVLDQVAELKCPRIVGIGLGGTESRYPAAAYERAFERARDAGLAASVHAGETVGSESIWEAIDRLQANRIGHGISATRDEKLMQRLAERRVHVECCPISNLRTGSIASLEAHPVHTFLERGLSISLNTDDPLMFGNTLASEYLSAMQHNGLTRDQIRKTLLNAAECSFLPWNSRRRLVSELVSDDAWHD